MPMITYEEVRPWVRSIRAKVVARKMPPRDIDRTVGIQEFANDTSLSDTQIEAIARWAYAGAPFGKRADLPPPVKWPDWSQWQAKQELGHPSRISC